MKQKFFALSLACLMVMALAGCSASRDRDSKASDYPSHSVTSDYDDRASAGIDDGAYYSDNVGGGQDDGGHVSDDYYQNNVSGNGGNPANGGNSSNGDNVMDDIGDSAGDLARGAGNVVRDAGDAIGDAANDVGRAMR